MATFFLRSTVRGIHQPGLAGFAAGRGVARYAARAGRTAGQCGRAFNDRGGRHGGGQPFGGQDAAPLRHRPCNAGKCDNDGLRTAGLCACAGLLAACAGGGANGPGRGRGGRGAGQLCGAALRGAPHELAALLLGRGSYTGACYPIAVPGGEDGRRGGYGAVCAIQFCLVAVLAVTLPMWDRYEDRAALRAEAAAAKQAGKKTKHAEHSGCERRAGDILFLLCHRGGRGPLGASYLVEARGLSAEAAARGVSLYFLGITLGRFLSGFASMRMKGAALSGRPARQRLGCRTADAAAACRVRRGGMVALGLGFAPVYPSMIHETPYRFGAERSQAVIGLQMACAYVGTTFVPALFACWPHGWASGAAAAFLLVAWPECCCVRNAFARCAGGKGEAYMRPLKIALLQIAPCGGLEENLEKGNPCLSGSEEDGGGYRFVPRDVEQRIQYLRYGPRRSGRLRLFRPAAALSVPSSGLPGAGNGHRRHASGRICGGPRNTLVLFDRFGERKLVYAKVHTCDFDVERELTPGEDFYVCALDTACGEVKVGAMICYDREFPESARVLMLKGAAYFGSQCLSYGDQPPFPAAGKGLSQHAGGRHLQLSGICSGLQRRLQRF